MGVPTGVGKGGGMEGRGREGAGGRGVVEGEAFFLSTETGGVMNTDEARLCGCVLGVEWQAMLSRREVVPSVWAQPSPSERLQYRSKLPPQP